MSIPESKLRVKYSKTKNQNVCVFSGMNAIPTETILLQSATGSSEYAEMDFSLSDESSYRSHVDKLKKLMESKFYHIPQV